MEESEIILFETKQFWLEWLEYNHLVSAGIWMRIAKKGSRLSSVTYDEALESALCYGWIDARKQRFDNDSWLQRFTPRKPKSGWSKINREKAVKLIESGEMKPPGLAAVEKAKQNGSWEKAYDPQSKIEAPEDFINELHNYPEALVFFNILDSRNRYAILHRLQTAKTEKNRQARLEKFIGMLIEGKKLY